MSRIEISPCCSMSTQLFRADCAASGRWASVFCTFVRLDLVGSRSEWRGRSNNASESGNGHDGCWRVGWRVQPIAPDIKLLGYSLKTTWYCGLVWHRVRKRNLLVRHSLHRATNQPMFVYPSFTLGCTNLSLTHYTIWNGMYVWPDHQSLWNNQSVSTGTDVHNSYKHRYNGTVCFSFCAEESFLSYPGVVPQVRDT